MTESRLIIIYLFPLMLLIFISKIKNAIPNCKLLMNVGDLKRFCKISIIGLLIIQNELDILEIRFSFLGLQFNFNKCQ